MKTKAGLWIDHSKAIIVTITDEVEEIATVISNVKKQLRRSGDTTLKGSFESQQVLADDVRQRSFTGHLNVYYDEVISSIRDAESLLLFGPGEAKVELLQRLEKNNPEGRIIVSEITDKMTDPQIAAKVRDYFKK